MGIFNKIKNVLFTEEEETTEIPLIEKEDYSDEIIEDSKKEVEEEISRFNNIRMEENLEKFEETPKVELKHEEIKREETRPSEVKVVEKSPFQSFDEEEFDRIAAINKNRLLERDRRAREEKERQNRYKFEETKIEQRLPKEETRKFKPTPVISPVYGILDKNYSKEDILPTASSEGTLPKIIDVDAVRKKAFGTLDQLEKNMEEDNLDDIKITSFDDYDTQKIELPSIDEIEDEITTPLPKIEEVEKELELDETPIEEDIEIEETPIEEDIEIEETPIEEDFDVKLDEVVDEKEDKIENELFDLIDSMYTEEGEN